MNNWICQIRPGNPYNGRRLRPEDFFRPERCMYIIFETGIEIDMFAPHSQTVIVRNKEFCIVKKPFKPETRTRRTILGEKKDYQTHEPNNFCVCLPEGVNGREVVFYSPTINPLTIR